MYGDKKQKINFAWPNRLAHNQLLDLIIIASTLHANSYKEILLASEDLEFLLSF